MGNQSGPFYIFWDDHHLLWASRQPAVIVGLSRPPEVLDRRRCTRRHPLDRPRHRPRQPTRRHRPSWRGHLYPRALETGRIHHAWPRRYPHRTQPPFFSAPAHLAPARLPVSKPWRVRIPAVSVLRDLTWLFSGGDLELLDWLTTYTFPAESKFEDLDYAERIYTDVVQRVIASGVSDRAIAASICSNGS